MAFSYFQEAFELFLTFSNRLGSKDDLDMKARFHDLLLHPYNWLRIYIVNIRHTNTKISVIRQNNIDLTFCQSSLSTLNPVLKDFDKDTIKKLLDCMDTECNKNVLRVMPSLIHTPTELDMLGISHKTIGLHRVAVLKYSESLANSRH